jgi:hypothetical protein
MFKLAPTRFVHFDIELGGCVFNAFPCGVSLFIGYTFDLVESGDGVSQVQAATRDNAW